MKLDIKELSFQHQAVRDLAWVMSSPGLLRNVVDGLRTVNDSSCAFYYEQGLASLRELDQNPHALQQWLTERNSYRLGVYFESLLIFWMAHIIGVEQLWSNVPVFREDKSEAGRQTLGEFDVLLSLADDNVAKHWEAAVKFYLRFNDDSGNVKWVGPAGRDRLDNKLNRMFTHQMVLSRTPEGRRTLDQLGLGAVDCEAFVKGYLFYPAHQQTLIEDDSWLSPHHLRGWWLRQGKDDLPQQNAGSRWCIVPRLQWLSPVRITDDKAGVLQDKDNLLNECAQHFTSTNNALLVAEMAETDGEWHERARGFVVSEKWPEMTA